MNKIIHIIINIKITNISIIIIIMDIKIICMSIIIITIIIPLLLSAVYLLVQICHQWDILLLFAQLKFH